MENVRNVPDTNVGDAISRQQAIDIALKYCPDDDGTCSEAGSDMRNMLDEIEALPPAEPQLVECDPLLAADKVAQGRLLSAYYYLDVLKDFSEMGYVLAKRREI